MKLLFLTLLSTAAAWQLAAVPRPTVALGRQMPFVRMQEDAPEEAPAEAPAAPEAPPPAAEEEPKIAGAMGNINNNVLYAGFALAVILAASPIGKDF